MTRVVSIHGWGGYPDEGWRPWLGKQLTKQGIEFINPQMPNTQFPQQKEWISFLKEVVGEVDENTFFIGHSLGVIAILRFIESLSKIEKVGGIVLVAGFTDDLGIPELANFFSTPITWEKIRSHLKGAVSLQSDNDPYNLEKYNEDFQRYLSAKTQVLHNKKHFSGDDGLGELPEALFALLSFIKK